MIRDEQLWDLLFEFNNLACCPVCSRSINRYNSSEWKMCKINGGKHVLGNLIIVCTQCEKLYGKGLQRKAQSDYLYTYNMYIFNKASQLSKSDIPIRIYHKSNKSCTLI